jgi:DNA helicase TIP49 (TBP-interacting protein)
MSLAERVTVNSLYTRSINLERDGEVSGIAYPYIPTTRALQTVGRVVDSISDKVAPRAWALVGPYGAGKSAFGLFLAQLLTNKSAASPRHETT